MNQDRIIVNLKDLIRIEITINHLINSKKKEIETIAPVQIRVSRVVTTKIFAHSIIEKFL
jgi:hypothetical protein